MNAMRQSKERNLTWSIQEDSNFQPLLEHFLELNLCILYVILKLEKSVIQRIKWWTIRSWNEGVRAIGSRSHQAKGQFCGLWNQPLAEKSQEDGCEMVSFRLRKFAAILHACEILLSASQYLRPTFLDFLLQIFDV